MPITKLDIAAVERFAEGREFGQAGSYVRIHGIARGELDPAAAENAVIVDLDKAERNTHGMVEYETDFFILRPAEPQRGSGVLVYGVTNRGRKVILGRLDEAGADADTSNPTAPRDVGLGFTLGRGYTLVWSGRDPAAPRQLRHDGAAAGSAGGRQTDDPAHSPRVPYRDPSAREGRCRSPRLPHGLDRYALGAADGSRPRK
jgi:hypothetical protein